jgi:phytoene dehydrogenase-like protein
VTHDVVIVGAGLAGLRAAAVLARRGLDVSVLDAADRPAAGWPPTSWTGSGSTRVPGAQHGLPGAAGHGGRSTRCACARSCRARRSARRRRAAHVRQPGAPPRPRLADRHRRAVRIRSPRRGWSPGPRRWSPPRRRRTAARIDRSAARDFTAAHLDGPVVEQFLRPFLSGVLADRELVTSAAYVRLVWRCFALGTIAVPADGMGALPALLAEGLPEKALSTGRRVTRVGPGQVEVDGETLRARAVVVATDPRAAGALLHGLDAPEMRTLTTYHHAATDPPADAALLHLDGTGGPIANTGRDARERRAGRPGAGVVDGRGACDPGARDPPRAEPDLRAATDGWELLRVDEVRDALPAFPAGRPLRSSVELGEGLFVAGDHRDTPSQQGALVSGRRAAEAVLAHLGA